MKTELKQCKKCKTMKNIKKENSICKRCEKEIQRAKLESEAGEILSEQGEHN